MPTERATLFLPFGPEAMPEASYTHNIIHVCSAVKWVKQGGVPNNSWTKCEWEGAEHDPFGAFDGSNNRINVPWDGVYLVASSLRINENRDQDCSKESALYVNGAAAAWGAGAIAPEGTATDKDGG